jgi:FlaA1/EpsC-like NDP-sugar epimerase
MRVSFASGEPGGTNKKIDAGWRNRLVAVGDLLVWPVCFYSITFLLQRPFDRAAIAYVSLTGMALQLAFGYATGLYRRRFQPLSFEEAGALAASAGLSGLFLAAAVVMRLYGHGSPYGHEVVLATWAGMTLMLGHRYVRRLRSRVMESSFERQLQPILVLGAGGGGYRSINAMRSFKTSPYRPVALLDDDPAKKHVRIAGLRVNGTSADMARVAAHYKATAILIAIPSASGTMLRHFNHLATQAGLETLVMPPAQRLVGAGSTHEITRYRDEDVLNRKVVDIDTTAVHELVAESVVLVTGAGGSIGSELVRQLAALEPAKLIVLDRDDSLLHHVMASVPESQRSVCVPELADIRDIDRLQEIFELHRPQLVFHAAALKHVPALESAPQEGWKTNVLGTANVITACRMNNVVRFVNISTDKAADPENVLGYTKRIAERLTAAEAINNQRPYVSVRFGNVIGSRGSAIETFDHQIAQDGPVTITHPDVTRYFMSVREAVRLTMQAATIGRPGEALVLDMGTPVRVLDVAKQLIQQSGREVDIVFTGLRPGEKMHEVLLGNGEAASRPFHSMIDHVGVPHLYIRHGLDACAAVDTPPTTIEGLRVMAECEARDDRASVRPSGHGFGRINA